jgi:cytochrome c peroxidase
MKYTFLVLLTCLLSSCGLVEDQRTKSKKSVRALLGQSGSGNNYGALTKVNPNSIPLLKGFTSNLYGGGTRVLFTHDAKLAIGFKHSKTDNQTTLRVSPLRPLPASSVGENDILSVGLPELSGSGSRTITTSLNGNVGRHDPYQGHLAIDPRYSEGFPFRVNSVDDCVETQPFKAHEKTSLEGIYECYYLMHFDTALQNENNGVGVIKAHFTVVTRAFGTNGKRLKNPTVNYANFTSDGYQRLKDESGAGAQGGIELSGTADGRVLVNIKGKVLWNEKSWSVDGWKFKLLGNVYEDANELICRKENCASDAEKEKLGDLYPFAKYPFRNYKGDFFPTEMSLSCGYFWMHPEGTDVFCRMNTPLSYRAEKAIEKNPDFKFHTFPPVSSHESSTGMEYSIMGQSTRWTVRVIDGGINTQRHAVSSTIERPFSLLFLGMSSGFWSDELVDGKNSSLPLNPRGVNYQFLTHQNHLNLSLSRDALKEITSRETPDSVMQYWETDITDCTDTNVSVALRFKAPYYYNLGSKNRTAHTLDTACHFKAKTNASEAGDNPTVTKLSDTQKIFLTSDIGTLFNTNEDIARASTSGSMMGFKGEGLFVKRGGNLTHKVGQHNPHRKPKPDGFSAEFAVRLLSQNKTNGAKQKLLTIPDLAEFGVENVDFQTVKFYAKNLAASSNDFIESKPIVIPTRFNFPLSSGNLTRGDWHHLGVRFKPTLNNKKLDFGFIIDGRSVGSVTVPKTSLIGTENAVVINGQCPSCAADRLFIIDEVVLSSVSRSLDYFAAGAHVTSTERQKFLSYNQKSQLLKNLDMGNSRVPNVDLAEEAFIPVEFAQYAEPSAKEKALAAVALGKKLFNSPLLSADKNGNPRLNKVTNKPVSCASCHLSNKAFTDGKKVAEGVGTGSLNTPTILNRSLGRKQFFNQRADDLIDQVLAPILNPIEMKSSIPNVLKAIKNDTVLPDMFAKAGLKIDRIGLATGLAAFTLKQTISTHQRMTINNVAADKGQKLFFGKARCASCHNGVSLSNERIHDTGVSADPKAFKTPPLVRLDRTAPYFHDGSASTLGEVVEFYNTGFTQNRTSTRSLDIDMRPLGLSDQEISDLVEYLKNIPQFRPR